MNQGGLLAWSARVCYCSIMRAKQLRKIVGAVMLVAGGLLALQPSAGAADGGNDRHCYHVKPICHLDRVAFCRCTGPSIGDCAWSCESKT
jgi:hypothetical protein